MGRSARLVPVAGFALAVIGLVLLVLEVVRTLDGSSLGTLGAVLLWVGVGFLAVAIVLLTLTLLSPVDDSAVDGVPADADAPLQP